jgi:tetratricopeptide (TPR) repeat protein
MNKRYTTPELDELFDRYRLSPDSTVFAPLADACRKAGMVEEALLVCARGIKAHPRYASGHVVHGKCYFDADRPADAEASFRRVLELDDRNLVALKYLGIIRAELGDAPGARRFFEDILSLDPEDRDIRRRLQQLGEAAAPAVAAPADPGRVAPAPAPVPDDERVHELRDVADDEFEGEPITLRDASVTSDEIATLTLADIYAAQGHPVKALRIYREVLRRQPNNDELKRKIDALEGTGPAEASPDVTDAADVETLLPPIPDVAAKTTPPADAGDERTTGRRPALPASPGGNPIDESRSYEQFKRWLRAMS